MIKNALIALFLTFGMLQPASAGDSFDLPIEGEILPGWQQADGNRMMGLRLNLAPGWKTYWRSPGDAGIPPMFDWSGSQNIRAVQIIWPAPSVFLTAGMRTIGYTGDVVLPVVLTPRKIGKPIAIKAELDLGVCSDICIPHHMELQAAIDDQNTKPTAAIAAALASRPYSAKEAGVASATCALSPTSDGLAIETTLHMPPTGGKEVVIVEPGLPGLWMSETKTNRRGKYLVATGEMATSDGGPIALDRSKIRITVLGQKHAVEIRGCKAG